MKEVADVTLPIPVGDRILETYGKVISGNMNDDIVNIAFMIKLSFNDFCFSMFAPEQKICNLLYAQFVYLFSEE